MIAVNVGKDDEIDLAGIDLQLAMFSNRSVPSLPVSKRMVFSGPVTKAENPHAVFNECGPGIVVVNDGDGKLAQGRHFGRRSFLFVPGLMSALYASGSGRQESMVAESRPVC